MGGWIDRLMAVLMDICVDESLEVDGEMDRWIQVWQIGSIMDGLFVHCLIRRRVVRCIGWSIVGWVYGG